MIKKNTKFTKKQLDYKNKLRHSENAQKMRCNANHTHCADLLETRHKVNGR